MTVAPSPNRCYQTSSSTGTGTFNLDGSPPAGSHSFVDGFGDGVEDGFVALDGVGNVEINTGVAASGSPDTLTRSATPIWSTNIVGGAYARVDFPAGPITIFSAPIAELMVRFKKLQSLSDGSMPVFDGSKWVSSKPGVSPANGISLAASGMPADTSVALSGTWKRCIVSMKLIGTYSNGNGTPLTARIQFTVKDNTTTVAQFTDVLSIPTSWVDKLLFTGIVSLPPPSSGAYTVSVADVEVDGGVHSYSGSILSVSAAPII
jgi:hypothetical protein